MLRVESVRKSFGARNLLDGVDLEVRGGDRIGLIGRNGEGKTTLMRVLAGLDTPDDGAIVLQRGMSIGYLRQQVDPTSGRSVMEEVREAQADLRVLEQELRNLEHQIAACGERGDPVPDSLAHRYDAQQRRFELRGGFAAESELRETLSGLGFDPVRWDAALASLSGGWLMRVELAKLLLARPEVLLLDEPTNHLDLPSIAWFEGVLRTYPGAVLVASHDRVFLDRHVTRIAELERGKLETYTGNFAAYLEQKAQREVLRDARARKLDQQIAHREKFVERFGAKATKASQAQSRKKQIAKLEAEREDLAAPEKRRSIKFHFPKAPRSGEMVLRLENVSQSYGAHTVYKNLDVEIRRGERVALVGPNGAGKSTLMRIAADLLDVQSGERELGHNVKLAFYAQHQLEALDPRRSVLEELGADCPLDLVPRLRTILGSFLFYGDDVQKKVSVLSGGEGARLALAKLLLQGANFLVLDEPTNHLDMQARDVLTEALTGFGGTLLFISHDRSLINALATHVIEIVPGPGCARVTRYAGGFDEYERRVRGETSEPAAAPARPARSDPHGAPAAPPRAKRGGGGNAVRKLRADASAAERAIEAAEAELERVDWLFADPAMARDGARMQQLTQQRAELVAKRDALYATWEELEQQLADLAPEPPG